ncbi:MAG: hypothetical protein U0637_13050 [Phycisphaerales bacterium]
MDGWIALLLLPVLAFGVPIGLGLLATGRTRRYRGPTTCSACRYELTGIDGRVDHCPECGARLEGDGTIKAGAERFFEHPRWVRFPAVLLLLAAPLGVLWVLCRFALSVKCPWCGWLLVAAALAIGWWVCRKPTRPMAKIRRGKPGVRGQSNPDDGTTPHP